MSASPVDPTRCPLCGSDNRCGMERGSGTCWCFASRVPDEVLERVPPEQRGLACVCERCASGAPPADEPAESDLARLARER